MRSSFFGINIATQGLFTARTSLDITNHNITNAETDGYSRQVQQQQALRPLPGNGDGMIGTGSTITSIERVRDKYLDGKYRAENSSLGEYEAKRTQLLQLETIINEPSDSGFTTVFNNMFEALDDLAQDPGEYGTRASFKDSVVSFTQQINDLAAKMSSMQRDLNFEVKESVETINSIASQIQRLNKQITTMEKDGDMANDLRDQRDLLVDQLSRIVNVDTKEVEVNGIKEFTVKINGQTLVSHYDAKYLEVVPREYKKNPEDEEGLYDIQWAATGNTFDIYDEELTGELKAYIDLRDGNNQANFKGTISSTQTPTFGATITLEDPSRIDIGSKGIATIDGRKVAYELVSTSGNQVEIQTPPSSGDCSVGNDAFSYTGYSFSGSNLTLNGMSGDFSDFPTSGTLDIGGYTIEYSNISPTTPTSPGDVTFTVTSITPSTAVADTTVEFGEEMEYKGIPYYIQKLNTFVRTFSEKMNEVYRSGVLEDGTTGQPLFTYDGYTDGDLDESDLSTYVKMTAENFQLSQDIIDDVNTIATTDDPEAAESDASLLQELKELKHDNTMFSLGEPANYMQAMMSEMAIDSKQAQSFEENQTNITKSIDNQRMSLSGVDLDEETQNLIKYQQAYNVAAKILTVIDEIYDVTINQMGSW